MMSRMLSADEAGVVGDDVDVRVEQRERLLGRVDLAVADAVEVVEDLALQVGGVDLVHVDDADRADAGRGEVQRGGRPEAAGARAAAPWRRAAWPGPRRRPRQQQVALVAVPLLRR
jgi:hypothetical protein